MVVRSEKLEKPEKAGKMDKGQGKPGKPGKDRQFWIIHYCCLFSVLIAAYLHGVSMVFPIDLYLYTYICIVT